MSKQYDKASADVEKRIEHMREKYHQALDGVTICALFVFSDESEHVLEQSGYPKLAITKIVGVKERAAGLSDALIVIDRYSYSGLSPKAADAMIDHELYHLERVIDEKTERPKTDVVGRPKLQMRKHDWELGWFDEIAQRHGEYSIEVMQAKTLMRDSGQLYLDFGQDEAA